MPSLSEQEKKQILELARASLRDSVCHHRLLHPIPADGVLGQKRGVFVSWHAKGRLRGCIGLVEPKETLGEGIVLCAASAAREDPRFAPMRADEVEDAEIEVSVLSPVEPITAEAVEIGKHGLLVVQGLRRGLLLPQVAVENGLTREKFLEETCRKAGLPRDAWKSSETRIFAFTCEIVKPVD
jgi:AmmeMemoRadiSam system protein A